MIYTLKRLPRQFCWENDSSQKLKDALRSSSTQILIWEFLNEDEPTTNVNTSLKKVEHILGTTAKRCLKIKSVKRHKRVQSSSNKKWFDEECRFKMHELRKLADQKHRDPLNATLHEEYHAVLKQYHEKHCWIIKEINITVITFLSERIPRLTLIRNTWNWTHWNKRLLQKCQKKLAKTLSVSLFQWPP